MKERLPQIESHVEELARSLDDAVERLSRLEQDVAELRRGRTATTAVSSSEFVEEVAEESPATGETGVDFVGVLTLVGRTLLAMAGAYLLRALTSEGLLPQALGVAAGLAYAALWIVLADRAGAGGRRLSAAFHGATAVLLAVPLIWETTASFAILSPSASAAALAVLSALTLGTAWRWSLRSVAWISCLAAGSSALMLGGSTHAPMPYAFYLVLLGLATLWLGQMRWLGQTRSWPGLAWITAALADLAILLLTAEDTIEKGVATLAGVVTIQLLFFALYTASFAFRAWRSEEGVTALAVLQTAAAAVVGWAGAASLLRSTASGGTLLGAASLLAAAGLYGVAFLGIDRRHKKSALFFSSVALFLVLAGSTSMLDRPAYLWALLALAGSALGSRFARLTASLHAAVFALAAAVGSGLLRRTVTFWVIEAGEWSAVTGDGLLALAAAAACLAFPVRGDLGFWRRYARLPNLVFLLVVVAASGGLLVSWAVPAFGAADPARLAAVRTAVMALSALVLAGLGRIERLREASLLVYPVLILGGIKLLAEDFPAGRPGTLFAALSLYGTALILAPRLVRAVRRAAPPDASTPV